jgi:ATP-binding cassette subfamily C protein
MSHADRDFNACRRRIGSTLLWVGLFSAVLSLLMLTGPLFMLQVYDRVLPSQSGATLVVLFSIVAYLYGIMMLLEHLRGKALALAAADLQDTAESHLLEQTLDARQAAHGQESARRGLRDLETVCAFLSSQTPGALLDLPWTPIFALLLFALHPALGLLCLGAVTLLLLLTGANQLFTRAPAALAALGAAQADALEDAMYRHAETITGLGMGPRLVTLWKTRRQSALAASVRQAARAGGFHAATKSMRLLLQSGILALGAFLAIRGALTPGAMIAATILMGRALAPIEQTISGWPATQKARTAWQYLAGLMGGGEAGPARVALPTPAGRIATSNLAVLAPGDSRVLLSGISFEIGPGEALGITGASGAGKSALARALAGAWPPFRGEVRLGGARLTQYDIDVLGRLTGYMPQTAELLPGTVAENIARFDPEATSEGVLSAGGTPARRHSRYLRWSRRRSSGPAISSPVGPCATISTLWR